MPSLNDPFNFRSFNFRPFKLRPAYVIAAVGATLVFVLIVLYAVDQAAANKIAKGVRVAGVPVGGLHPDQARAKLTTGYLKALKQPVEVNYGGHSFHLTEARTHITVDLDATVSAALSRSRSGDFVGRAARELFGGTLKADLDPDVEYSKQAVSDFVHRVQEKIDQPPHDASVKYNADSIGNVKSQPGHTLDTTALRKSVTAALLNPTVSHRLRPVVATEKPRITTAALARRNPIIITIDRANFRLRLWKHLKLKKSYPIAVGQQGLETPAGLYKVLDKQVDPSWHVPNSAWAGSLAGMVIPPGPADPIKARWMGIFNGAGIHGTDQLGSLGTAASHGCIRMAIPDVIELYDQVEVGDPVFIA